MSTTARKARKRAGVKFERTPKTPTPLMERSWFAALVRGPVGTRHADRVQPRSAAKIKRALKARGIE